MPVSVIVKSQRIGKDAYRRDNERMIIRALTDQAEINRAAEINRLNDVIAAMSAQMERDVKSAWEKGTQDGYRRGLDEGKSIVEPAIDRLNMLTEDIQASMQNVWDDTRRGIISLVLAISRKILGSVAGQYHDLTVDLTKRAVKMMRDQTSITALINPADAEALRSVRPNILSLSEAVKSFTIEERSDVPPGGVIVETDAVQLDARLDEQMSAIEAALRPGWSEGGESGMKLQTVDTHKPPPPAPNLSAPDSPAAEPANP